MRRLYKKLNYDLQLFLNSYNMIKKMKNKIHNKFFYKKTAWHIDSETLAKYEANPDFPYLISYPRTGSHWLRNLIELYFKKPCLPTVFHHEKVKDYICYWDHDGHQSLNRKNLIYLYRENPIDVVYSFMRYHKKDLDNIFMIKYLSTTYGLHLSKWLFEEKYSSKKTIITYEGLRNNLEGEFSKICNHFDHTIDNIKLESVSQKTSKEDIKKKTIYNPNVVNLSEDYTSMKKYFADKHTNYILENLYKQNPKIEKVIKIN